tara:strand:- start:782 stop:3844 length:3063 start_codon:yes stop_codon:yes gene_type:complete
MITEEWLKSLRLEDRKSPEFIRSGDDLRGIPHGALIQKSFDELELAGMHCISGVPSIAFLVLQSIDQNHIDKVHKSLWNQGLATLLLVITNNTLRAYSLSHLPTPDHKKSDKLVKVFDLLNDALEIKNLVLGMESGRFVNEHQKKFDSKYRVDQVLLVNLESTVKHLVAKNMRLESAQALLMQIMFIAYLEDKKIINDEYFRTGTNNQEINSLISLLGNGGVKEFNKLFNLLKEHFNGDLFVAPCSFDIDEEPEEITKEQIKILSEFRAGNIDLSSGQFQFWPYDFKFIPIDLISAVYDRFLGFDPASKRESGAYYTPMFLADLVAEQAWSELSDKQKIDGHFVDPSCGSGIFLVRMFEKMIDEWRFQNRKQHPTWPALKAMISRIHGFDIKKEAVRVAAFSLYIALLENLRPAEILSLMKQGRLLPKLCDETLQALDFFEVDSESHKYDLIIGNPPWVSRRNGQINAVNWCKKHGYEMPTKEISWGFAWKALSHAGSDGVIALLLKATSFITSQSSTILNTRQKWMGAVNLKRVINFADTRFQLFDGGDAPTALMIYQPRNEESSNYIFDYWVPKADLNLRTKRQMTLSSMDQSTLPIDLAIKDQMIMKRHMWMQTPDAKLFQYINSKPKLSNKLVTFQESKKKGSNTADKWIIGQGFKKAKMEKIYDADYSTDRSNIVTKIPHLNMSAYTPVVMPSIGEGGWATDIVHRVGFEDGFKAPHIIIPQGIERSQGRLRASYCEQELSFLSSLQAIHIHNDEYGIAKFLTVLLNSSLVAWYLFHNSSVSGMERDKVPQQELLDIPFPLPESFQNTNHTLEIFSRAVALIDDLLDKKEDLLRIGVTQVYPQIDKIIYEYFGLSNSDILIIEDTLNYIIPSMQPRANSKKLPILWRNTTEMEWQFYAESLSAALGSWINKPFRAVTEFVGASQDLVVLGVHLTDSINRPSFSVSKNTDIDNVLSKIWHSLPAELPGNFQLIPDLRVFIDDVLYIVKPRKKRFWLGSTALADADAIASDLISQKG